MSGELHIVVLAAGRGTRMRSALPKVLHPLGGRPLLDHVLETAAALEPACIHVVVGSGAEAVRSAFGDDPRPLCWVTQEEPLGTGHAVLQALPGIPDAARVLVTYGDVPLAEVEVLRRCAADASPRRLNLVTAVLDDPGQLGRIVRDDAGAVTAIVEHRDADAAQRQITEINTGVLAAGSGLLKALLAEVGSDNAQGEFYLTDVVALAAGRGIAVAAIVADDPERFAGINDRRQLAGQERLAQRLAAERLMDAGATLADPARLDVRGVVDVGEDVFIDANVVFEGRVRLGRNVVIGTGAVVRDSELGDGVRVEPYTLIDGARVADNCVLGPFARIRPGSEFAEAVKIGNFVETKKVYIGAGSKASHLTYLGDARLGEDCNVGAGTVTCNYDGIAKHRTEVGDRVFVGTNSTLVAPLRIGDDAFIAAGSTITDAVDAEQLALGRGRQRNVDGWVRPDRRPAGDAPGED